MRSSGASERPASVTALDRQCCGIARRRRRVRQLASHGSVSARVTALPAKRAFPRRSNDQQAHGDQFGWMAFYEAAVDKRRSCGKVDTAHQGRFGFGDHFAMSRPPESRGRLRERRRVALHIRYPLPHPGHCAFQRPARHPDVHRSRPDRGGAHVRRQRRDSGEPCRTPRGCGTKRSPPALTPHASVIHPRCAGGLLRLSGWMSRCPDPWRPSRAFFVFVGKATEMLTLHWPDCRVLGR